MKFKFGTVIGGALIAAACGLSGVANAQNNGLDFAEFLGWDVRYLAGGNISSCESVRQELMLQHPALYGTGEFAARTNGALHELTIKGQQLRSDSTYDGTDPEQSIFVTNVSNDRSYFDWTEVERYDGDGFALPKKGFALIWVDAGNGITTHFATITDAVKGRRVSDRNSTQKINTVGFCAYGDTPAAYGGLSCKKEGLALGVWCQASGNQVVQGIGVHAGNDEICTCEVTNPYMIVRQCNDPDSFQPVGFTASGTTDPAGDGICDPRVGETCCSITPFCETYDTAPELCAEEVIAGPSQATQYSRGRSPQNYQNVVCSGGYCTGMAAAACSDGVDNDGDGSFDYWGDASCNNDPYANSEN